MPVDVHKIVAQVGNVGSHSRNKGEAIVQAGHAVAGAEGKGKAIEDWSCIEDCSYVKGFGGVVGDKGANLSEKL